MSIPSPQAAPARKRKQKMKQPNPLSCKESSPTGILVITSGHVMSVKKYSIDDTRILASVIRRNRSYCRAIQLTALEMSKAPNHDMSKAHFIGLAIVEIHHLFGGQKPLFLRPPLTVSSS